MHKSERSGAALRALPADVATGEEVLVKLLEAGSRGEIAEGDGHGRCLERYESGSSEAKKVME